MRRRTDASAREAESRHTSQRPNETAIWDPLSGSGIEAISSTSANTLLSGLPDRDRTFIADRCERITLERDQILTRPDARIEEVYFPVDSFILRLAGAAPVGRIGIGLIGNEGMLGASLALGIGVSSLHANVQGSGIALCMGRADFQLALHDCPVLERRLRLYLYFQLGQDTRTAACAFFHVLETRLANWLLMIHDRVQADRIDLTQGRLARMLGTQRTGVSTAASLLQRRKLITYSRGHIVIVNRKGLEKVACGCYRAERTSVKRVTTDYGDGADTENR